MGMRKYGTAPDQQVLPEEGDGALEKTGIERTEELQPDGTIPVTYGLPHPRSVLNQPLPRTHES